MIIFAKRNASCKLLNFIFSPAIFAYHVSIVNHLTSFSSPVNTVISTLVPRLLNLPGTSVSVTFSE